MALQPTPEDLERSQTVQKNYFTENDPTMRLSQSGVRYDDRSVLQPNQHSRSTYKKLIRHQLHQAESLILDKSATQIHNHIGQLSGLESSRYSPMNNSKEQFENSNFKFLSGQ